MKKVFSLVLMMAALLLAPTLLAAAESSATIQANIEEVTYLAAAVQAFTPAENPNDQQIQLAVGPDLDCIRCRCLQLQTPPTTRVGATCLRARQNAAAAARTLAVCPPNSTGPCGATTHTVAPCQVLSTGGYSATAIAYYKCEFCFDVCPDSPDA